MEIKETERGGFRIDYEITAKQIAYVRDDIRSLIVNTIAERVIETLEPEIRELVKKEDIAKLVQEYTAEAISHDLIYKGVKEIKEL